MNDILLEATYGLSNHNISKTNLLQAVLGNKMASLFIENKELIKKFNSTEDIITWLEAPSGSSALKCGFSIRSNTSGGSEKKDLFNIAAAELGTTDVESKQQDIIYHHVYRTHKIKHIMPLTTVQHTALHNRIRQLFTSACEQGAQNVIDDIYKEYLSAKPKQISTYADFGNRLKYYEVALIKVAKVALDLLTIEKFAEFHTKALSELQNDGTIPKTVKVIQADKLVKNKNSISEEFRIYENLWD